MKVGVLPDCTLSHRKLNKSLHHCQKSNTFVSLLVTGETKIEYWKQRKPTCVFNSNILYPQCVIFRKTDSAILRGFYWFPVLLPLHHRSWDTSRMTSEIQFLILIQEWDPFNSLNFWGNWENKNSQIMNDHCPSKATIAITEGTCTCIFTFQCLQSHFVKILHMHVPRL